MLITLEGIPNFVNDTLEPIELGQLEIQVREAFEAGLKYVIEDWSDLSERQRARISELEHTLKTIKNEVECTL